MRSAACSAAAPATARSSPPCCDADGRLAALRSHRAPAGAAVGARLPRLDGRAKVDGSESFGADGWPAGPGGAEAVRSPYSHARFRFGDLGGLAAARPGLAAVFTAADIPGRNRFGVIPAFADQPALAEADGPLPRRGGGAGRLRGRRALRPSTGFPVTWSRLPRARIATEAAEAPERC